MNKAPLDLSLFRWIETQTSDPDREALLSLKEVICAAVGSFRYLEVGSHLGGSLQPHVADARCVKIYSIDPRPLEQPDERWAENYKYEGNSTGRMMELLNTVPGADTGKIETFEACSWDLKADSIANKVEFAFIDGEHTNVAALRDYEAVRRFIAETAVVAFHDSFVTPAALLKIAGGLGASGGHGFLYYPHSNVVAATFGPAKLEESLLEYGWEKGLPFSHWYTFKQAVKRRLRAFGR
jgi:hypothetical protein